jgi:hypothetical protein
MKSSITALKRFFMVALLIVTLSLPTNILAETTSDGQVPNPGVTATSDGQVPNPGIVPPGTPGTTEPVDDPTIENVLTMAIVEVLTTLIP